MTPAPMLDIDGVRLYCGDARDVLRNMIIPDDAG